MDHHINLVLKAVWSGNDVVKSFKTTPQVGDSGAFFGLTPFHADLIDNVE